MKHRIKKFLKITLLLLIISVSIGVLYFFVYLQPRNDLNWEVGYENLPRFAFQDNFITITGLRDDHFDPQNGVVPATTDRIYHTKNISNVWFVLEAFSEYKAVAHTYFIFDFIDQDPIGFSVEARREKGEKYSLTKGVLNQFELIHVWSTERDATIRRVMSEKTDLYMFPLKITDAGKQGLLKQLAQQSHELESTPFFYNTLFSNCTNELAKIANKVKPNSIPYDISYQMTGYSPAYLYKLGFIEGDVPYEELEKKHRITDFVKENYRSIDFSPMLRAFLLQAQ